MPEDKLKSELAGLSPDQLREVMHQLCTSDPRPASDGEKEDDRNNDIKTTVLDLIKEAKSRQPGGGEGNEGHSQETPSLTVSRDSATLVPSPNLSHESQSADSPSTEQSSPPPSSRPHRRRTNHLSAAAVQHLFGMEELEPIQRCGRCRNWFTESHNSDIACTYHPARVHFRDAEHIAYVPTFAAWEHRYGPSSFHWACCRDQVGISAGCVSARHDASASAPWQCYTPPASYRNVSSSWQFRTESARAWM